MKNVKILGTGCRKCVTLKDQTELALRNLGIEAQVEKVEEINQITAYGVFMTPALVIDGEVKIQGRVPSVAEIEKLFQ